MLPGHFFIIGAVVSSLGDLYYLKCTVQGKVRPNRMTWLLWGLIPMIAFVAQYSQDVGLVMWATFAAAAIPLTVTLVAQVNPKAYWEIKRSDYLYIGIALLGVVLWLSTDSPNLAIIFAIVADFFAGLPTIIKAYTNPETESSVAYGITAVGSTIVMLTIVDWTFEVAAFVVYVFMVNIVLSLLASRKGSVTEQV